MEGIGEYDEAVRSTNTEACGGKVSAVRKGYWSEPALLALAAAARLNPPVKPPEINRGYYARVASVRALINRFVAVAGPAAQIVNLGCGFDALAWQRLPVANLVELDFPAIVMRKANAIKRDAQLGAALGDVTVKGGGLHAPGYHLLGCDLRCLDDVRAKLATAAVDTAAPTLFLAECVLVYVKPDMCQRLLAWIARDFPQAAFLSYEQVNLNDNFGRVMLDNLNARGCPLVGAEFCTSLQTQNQRFLSSGWKFARSWNMETVWNYLPVEERQRVESIEALDEGVLLIQLLQHYCIVVASQTEQLNTITLSDR